QTSFVVLQIRQPQDDVAWLDYLVCIERFWHEAKIVEYVPAHNLAVAQGQDVGLLSPRVPYFTLSRNGEQGRYLPMRRNLPQPLDAGVLVRRIRFEPAPARRAHLRQRLAHDATSYASHMMTVR